MLDLFGLLRSSVQISLDNIKIFQISHPRNTFPKQSPYQL